MIYKGRLSRGRALQPRDHVFIGLAQKMENQFTLHRAIKKSVRFIFRVALNETPAGKGTAPGRLKENAIFRRTVG